MRPPGGVGRGGEALLVPALPLFAADLAVLIRVRLGEEALRVIGLGVLHEELLLGHVRRAARQLIEAHLAANVGLLAVNPDVGVPVADLQRRRLLRACRRGGRGQAEAAQQRECGRRVNGAVSSVLTPS
jgi:hypothetical protein